MYGSLEYKDEEAFYVAIFDGEAIDRVGMDAETDGVMTTVHLQEVVDDFSADMDGDGRFDGDTAATADHRYGSSGIDGVAFGPDFGERAGPGRGAKQYLVVAYGVYRNDGRIDNDHQVLLQYDVSRWKRYERPLSQTVPHRSGPADPRGKHFVLTGNTRFGVQNLEHDETTGHWMMGVYPGSKPAYPNYPFFVVDGTVRPRTGIVRGQAAPERGSLLELLPQGLYHPASGTFGWTTKADVGMVSLGRGLWYLVQDGTVQRDGRTLATATAHLYRWTGRAPDPFERVR